MKKLSTSRFLFLLAGCAFFISCISAPPNLDYTLARSALASAKEAEAPKLSPGYWHKASSAYKKAQQLYKIRDRDEAQKMFRRAKKYAEMAENSSRLKRAKGESF